MVGWLNKVQKFFKLVLDSLPPLDQVLNFVKQAAPTVGSVLSVIPGVGAAAGPIGEVVGETAGKLSEIYKTYKKGKKEEQSEEKDTSLKKTIAKMKTSAKSVKGTKTPSVLNKKVILKDLE
jgi:hypothetical protein